MEIEKELRKVERLEVANLEDRDLLDIIHFIMKEIFSKIYVLTATDNCWTEFRNTIWTSSSLFDTHKHRPVLTFAFRRGLIKIYRESGKVEVEDLDYNIIKTFVLSSLIREQKLNKIGI
jgi:hypothetical protein